MSKIKEHLLTENYVEIQCRINLLEKIYNSLYPEPRLDESDIDEMEKSYCNNSNPNFTAFSKNINVSVSNNNVNTTERISGWEQQMVQKSKTKASKAS